MFGKHTFLLLILSCCVSDIAAIVQDFYWRDYVPGDIAYDALEGAPGRYVGQVHTVDSLTVATIYPHNHTALAVTSTGSKILIDKNIKILCSPDLSRFYWEHVDFNKSHDTQLKNAVKGGFEKDSNIFIGKTIDEDEWKIGQVLPIGHRLAGLWVWKKTDGSRRHDQFDLLKYNMTFIAVDGTVIYDSAPDI